MVMCFFLFEAISTDHTVTYVVSGNEIYAVGLFFLICLMRQKRHQNTCSVAEGIMPNNWRSSGYCAQQRHDPESYTFKKYSAKSTAFIQGESCLILYLFVFVLFYSTCDHCNSWEDFRPHQERSGQSQSSADDCSG